MTSFDRVKVRVAPGTGEAASESPPIAGPEVVDLAGRAALYSVAPVAPGFGRVALDCSTCQNRSLVSYWEVLRLALPAFHVPVLRGRHNWWMRCPACNRRQWVAVALW